MMAWFAMGEIYEAQEGRSKIRKPVEMVTLTGGFLGKDTVTRPATDDDRGKFPAEYAEFKEHQAAAEAAVKAAEAADVD